MRVAIKTYVRIYIHPRPLPRPLLPSLPQHHVRLSDYTAAEVYKKLRFTSVAHVRRILDALALPPLMYTDATDRSPRRAFTAEQGLIILLSRLGSSAPFVVHARARTHTLCAVPCVHVLLCIMILVPLSVYSY